MQTTLKTFIFFQELCTFKKHAHRHIGQAYRMSVIAKLAKVWKTLATKSSYWHTLDHHNSKMSTNLAAQKSLSVKYKNSLHCNKVHSLNSKLHFQFIRHIHSTLKLKEREHFLQSESASYEGTGKTTVTILNEDVQHIMIDAFSLSGFRLNTGMLGMCSFD